MVVLSKDGKVLTLNNSIICSQFVPIYMETPGMSVQTSDEYNGIVFAWNEVDGSHVEIPINIGGCTLFSYYHCCQTINARYGGYVADSFMDWFNHYGGEDYFRTIYYPDLFKTLETLTGIHCENESVKHRITEENYNKIKQKIYDEICGGMPVTIGITLYGANGATGGHSIMAKGIDSNGRLIVCDSLSSAEVIISYEDLIEINGHDGFNTVRII